MSIDLIAQLAPFLWGLLVMLLVMLGAIAVNIDPDLAEIYLGDGRILIASLALAALTGAALVAAPGGPTGHFLP